MIVDVSKKILIVGLGLLGGSYAKVLKRFGFPISAITKDQSSIDYALSEGMIDEGSIELDEKLIGEADLVIFALYPHIFMEWIEKNLLQPILWRVEKFQGLKTAQIKCLQEQTIL